MQASSPLAAINQFRSMLQEMGMPLMSGIVNNIVLEQLCESVNPIRLRNNPISLDKDDIKEIYTQIFIKQNTISG